MGNKEQNIDKLRGKVFHLMSSLISCESFDRIILLYFNAINALFENLNLSYETPDLKPPSKYYIEIVSNKTNYGYICSDTIISSISEEEIEILYQSVKLLAVILDSLDFKTIKHSNSSKETSVQLKYNDEDVSVLNFLYKNFPDLLLKFDLNLNCLFVNNNIKHLINLTANQLVGKNIEEWNISENIKNTLNSEIKKVIKRKTSVVKIIHSYNNRKIYEIRFIPDLDKNNVLSSVFILGQDITEKYNVEKELIRVKKKAEESDKLKLAFQANISHEIRTPLNGIIGFARLLVRKGISDERKADYMRIIESSTENLLLTMSNILEISKIESGDFNIIKEHILLKEFISVYYSEFKNKWKRSNKQNINFELGLPTENKLVSIYTDEYRLKEVLNNLLDNAFKFTKRGIVKLGYYSKDNQLIFYVKDTGIGIKKNDLENIFIRFFQIDYSERKEFGGLGLGLTISKAIVEKLGGKIWIESDYHEGTTIFFNIPLQKKESIIKQNKKTENGFVNIEK